MPVVSRVFGGLDFSNWFFVLGSPPPPPPSEQTEFLREIRDALIKR